MKPEIGISDADRLSVAKELTKLLADEYVLVTKTKNAHWNIEGNDFYDKHILFESQYKQLDEMVDSIAERIRTIGHYAYTTLKSILELTHLSEESRQKNDGPGFIQDLLNAHESIIIHCRENIHTFGNDFKDFGTSDFLTGIMEKHEKMAWFLRSHLQ